MVGKFVQTKTWDMSSRRCMFRAPFWAWPTSHFYCFFFTATFLLFSATSAKKPGYVEEVLYYSPDSCSSFVYITNKSACTCLCVSSWYCPQVLFFILCLVVRVVEEGNQCKCGGGSIENNVLMGRKQDKYGGRGKTKEMWWRRWWRWWKRKK